jgi:hypothetical protein
MVKKMQNGNETHLGTNYLAQRTKLSGLAEKGIFTGLALGDL